MWPEQHWSILSHISFLFLFPVSFADQSLRNPLSFCVSFSSFRGSCRPRWGFQFSIRDLPFFPGVVLCFLPPFWFPLPLSVPSSVFRSKKGSKFFLENRKPLPSFFFLWQFEILRSPRPPLYFFFCTFPMRHFAPFPGHTPHLPFSHSNGSWSYFPCPLGRRFSALFYEVFCAHFFYISIFCPQFSRFS